MDFMRNINVPEMNLNCPELIAAVIISVQTNASVTIQTMSSNKRFIGNNTGPYESTCCISIKKQKQSRSSLDMSEDLK